MDIRPKFSIIVPVYNVEKYLSRCLESLVSQTFMDIEIICVNDGSTDGSAEILDQYAREDSRITIVTQENKGLPAARNSGIAAAEGEYYLFVDSDDYIREDSCEVLYRECVQTQADMIVFGTNVIPYIDDADHRWMYEAMTITKRRRYEKQELTKALFTERSSKPFVWNICYKSSLFTEKKLSFDEEMRYGEDMVFLFKVFSIAQSALYVPDALYTYICARQNSLMVTASKKKKDKMQWHLKILEKVISDWSEKGILDQNQRGLSEFAVSFFYGDLVSGELDGETKKEVAKRLVRIMTENNLDKTKIKNVYANQRAEIMRMA